MVGIKLLLNKKMSIKNKIPSFDKPNYVYIPLVNHTNLACECCVKKGDKVYKGSVIGRRNDHFQLPIHASVSGSVVGIEERPYLNGALVKCVVIENDFKEKVVDNFPPKKDITDYTAREFVNILRDCGIVGMGGSGFPTYVKYDTKMPINTILVNGVECEPYITADYVLMRDHAEEILECIDAILEITGATKGIIAIKVHQPEIKKEFKKYMGTYPNIELIEVADLYPSGWEKSLIKQVLNIDYDKLPIEKGVVVNNVSTIYAIYEALKYHKPVMEKIITITGDKIEKPQNVVVKIGTQVKDLIDYIGGIKPGNKIKLIAGGPMMGVAILTDDLVVSNNLNCLLIMENQNEHPYIECMRCGKCVNICPAKLSPVLIKNNVNNVEHLKYLQPEKCIECGLCSYICPSKVDVREYVKKAKLKRGEKNE